MKVSVSVVVTTYNHSAWLEKVLWGYAVQTHREFELVIADDGSGPETRSLLDRFHAESGMRVLHVWHEDQGFRKCEILNRAILLSSGDYLIFSDGDCIPRNDFVEAHVRLAEPGSFLSGGYLKLPLAVSERIMPDDVRSGRAFRLSWLVARGYNPGHKALRFVQSRLVARWLDAITPTDPTWNGHNASTWREAIFSVNGFEHEMGWGGEDRALGERLENLGLTGKQIRFRAPVLHLDHGRPYRDLDRLRRNREIRERIRHNREVRARAGLTEIQASADADRISAE